MLRDALGVLAYPVVSGSMFVAALFEMLIMFIWTLCNGCDFSPRPLRQPTIPAASRSLSGVLTPEVFDPDELTPRAALEALYRLKGLQDS